MLDGLIPLRVKNDKDCIFCKHCTDIIYDFHGPYMWFCELNRSECDAYKADGTRRLPEEHTCENFEDSEENCRD